MSKLQIQILLNQELYAICIAQISSIYCTTGLVQRKYLSKSVELIINGNKKGKSELKHCILSVNENSEGNGLNRLFWNGKKTMLHFIFKYPIKRVSCLTSAETRFKSHKWTKRTSGGMSLSLLLLAATGLALVLYNSHQGEASDMSDVLQEELSNLADEMSEKRGSKRPPCGFTWRCRRRSKSRGRRIWGKKVRGKKYEVKSVKQQIKRKLQLKRNRSAVRICVTY